VCSFIVGNCRKIFQNLDTNVTATGGSLPPQIQSGISSVRSQIEALGPATIQANFGLTPSRLLLGFAAGPRVFGLVQTTPIVVLIFAMFTLLFAMAIIIAKPALEALLRQLIVVLNKIADLSGIR